MEDAILQSLVDLEGNNINGFALFLRKQLDDERDCSSDGTTKQPRKSNVGNKSMKEAQAQSKQ